MRGMRAFILRIAGLFSTTRDDRDFANELDSHLQMHIDDNVRSGMSPAEARRRALIQLGGVVQTAERYRDRRGFPLIDGLRQDLAYALRMLRRNPAFTCTAVLTLALGIGANTAIFSVVNAVLLQPLDLPEPDRLVMIFGTDTRRGDIHDVSSFPDFVDWSAQNRVFERLAAFTSKPMTSRAAAGESELMPGKQISPGMFETLGVQPVLGRSFRIEEQQQGDPSHVVILSGAFWKRQYNSAPDALGQMLRINDEAHTIVGVMPPALRVSPGDVDEIYTPLVVDTDRGHGYLRVIGRMRRGVTLAQAQADMDRIAAHQAALYPRNNATVGTNVVPLVDAFAFNVRSGLLILFGVVGVVLLIACTNVAGLLLARAATRRRELAVRAALGAARGRLARQLFTESIVLALIGGAIGLAIADVTARVLSVLLASSFQVPRVDGVRTDFWVLGFTVLVSLATGVLFGVAPAFSSASPDLNGDLHDSNRSFTSARAPRLRSGLVIVETALALMLLAGAGVLLRNFATMRSTPTGFQPRDLLVADIWLPQPRFANLPARAQFYSGVLAELRARPGIRGAAFVNDVPLSGGTDSLGFHIVGREDPKPGGIFRAGFNIATTDYFRTMGIPLEAGREFTDGNTAGTLPVVVINETAARRFWPGESPIDHQIVLPGSRKTSITLTVVGVTGDVRHESLAIPPRPEFFLNSLQAPLAWNTAALTVSTIQDPSAVIPEIKAIVRGVDPNVPIRRIDTMDHIVAASIAEPRVYTLLLGIFAALAVALVAVGMYGLVSYSASQRMHEMGVRVALGASRREILRLVLGHGWKLGAIGIAIGLGAAAGVTRVLVALIRGVEPNDPVTFGLVAALLLFVALGASYIPARRAARIDPMLALRSE